MKRFISIISVMLMSVCLFATHTVGFGNDTFSYGFSDDRDDGCTHSILLGYEDDLDEFTKFNVNAQILAYTVRPMTYTNIKGETEFFEGRIDELRLTGGLSRDIKIDGATLESSFLVGYSFYGNFGGEFLQNLCHDVLSLKEVKLEYSSLSPRATLLVNLGVRTNGKAYVGANAWVGYEGLLKMGGKAYFGYGVDKAKFKSFLGLEANLNLDNSVLSVASMMATGMVSGLELDTGFILVDYKRYHDRNTGFGTIAFAIGKENTWEENDVFASYGMFPLYGKPINTVVVRKPLGDNIQVVFKDDFISEVYQNSPVKGLTSLSSLEVGFRGGDTWYAQTTVGYGWTMCEDHSVNYNVEHPVVQKEGYITSSLELGYAWMSPLTVGSSNLGIEAFCGIHMKGNTNLLRNHTEFANLKVNDVEPYFGVRAIIGMDF